MLARTKKVFTERLSSIESLEVAADTLILSDWTWQPQEDIEIIGVDGDVQVHAEDIAVDGLAGCWFELSQSGAHNRDSRLMVLSCEVVTESVVAASQTASTRGGHANYMLPEGYRIPVAEGNTIHIHFFKYGAAVKAANAHAEFTVFYVKAS